MAKKPPKNPHAAALVRLRWQKTSKKARAAHSRKMHDALAPEARSARGRKAAIAMHRNQGHKLKDPPELDGEPTPDETADE